MSETMTPGEWVTDGPESDEWYMTAYPVRPHGEKYDWIALVGTPADARAIATLPELLSVATAVVRAYEGIDNVMPWVHDARRAIAKARGETHAS